MKICGEISSSKGFYIGDICYAMKDELYHGVWGDRFGFNDGCHEIAEHKLRFAVAGTAYGDGTYGGTNGFRFPVDAGNIGVVPLEMCSGRKLEGYGNCGMVVDQPGTVRYSAEDGVFFIVLPDGSNFSIDTHYDADEDSEDYEDDDDEYDV
jgi:hypothetical protein|nr:MAG TPA_asm: hypothetical protein [Caudoviricetes sp.]